MEKNICFRKWLSTSCTCCRNDYYENNKEALEKFIEDLKSSIAFINSVLKTEWKLQRQVD